MNYKVSVKKLNLLNRKLKSNLPFCFLFSDRKKIPDLPEIINFLPKNSALIIREYNLSENEREKFAEKIVSLTKQKQLFSFIGKSPKLAQKLGANGIHFSDFDKISVLQLKKYHKKFFISFACHSEKSLRKINNSILAKYIDVIFLSPIFATSSHENSKIFGLRNFRKILQSSKKTIYPLGGINEKNLQILLKEKKFSGFGGIDIFFRHCEERSDAAIQDK